MKFDPLIEKEGQMYSSLKTYKVIYFSVFWKNKIRSLGNKKLKTIRLKYLKMRY